MAPIATLPILRCAFNIAGWLLSETRRGDRRSLSRQGVRLGSLVDAGRRSVAARPRVLLLTHYYPPEVGAPQTRLSMLADRLNARGFDVTVHTGFPNYPTGRVLAPYRNRPFMREQMGDVRVVRSAVFPAPNRGTLPRLISHTAFACSSIATAPATGPQDVVVVETPPLFTAGAAIAYAGLKRAPLVVHASDLWPESAVQLGVLRRTRLVGGARRLERRVYDAAVAVTVPTPGMVKSLRRHPAAAPKVRHMPPAVDTDGLRDTPVPPLMGPLRVVFAGTIGLAQGIQTLIDAAALAGPDAVEVTIAGWGAEAREAQEGVRTQNLANVRLVGPLPHDQVLRLYEHSHVGVVLLRDRPIFHDALPTKLFECLAAGRPVVVSARGASADVVERAGAGMAVPAENPAALSRTFIELRATDLQQLGRRARQYAVTEASAQASVQRWVELLSSVIGFDPKPTSQPASS